MAETESGKWMRFRCIASVTHFLHECFSSLSPLKKFQFKNQLMLGMPTSWAINGLISLNEADRLVGEKRTLEVSIAFTTHQQTSRKLHWHVETPTPTSLFA